MITALTYIGVGTVLLVTSFLCYALYQRCIKKYINKYNDYCACYNSGFQNRKDALKWAKDNRHVLPKDWLNLFKWYHKWIPVKNSKLKTKLFNLRPINKIYLNGVFYSEEEFKKNQIKTKLANLDV